MELYGDLSGTIGLDGGGADVTITPTLSSGTKIADYEIDGGGGSLYAPTPESPIEYTASSPLSIDSQHNISIDLSGYASTSYVSNQILGMTQYVDGNFQRKLSAGTGIDIGLDNSISTSFDITDYQPKLTAGENITIDVNNVISASGGGGGFDLPTNGTPVEIGTFGNKSIYMQYVNVNVHTGATDFSVWIGQSGDYVLGYNMHIYSPSNQGALVNIPTNDSSIDTYFYTNIYTVIPTINLHCNIKQVWLADVMCILYPKT